MWWLKLFPLPRDETHLFIGLAGEGHFDCFCGAEREDSVGAIHGGKSAGSREV